MSKEWVREPKGGGAEVGRRRTRQRESWSSDKLSPSSHAHMRHHPRCNRISFCICYPNTIRSPVIQSLLNPFILTSHMDPSAINHDCCCLVVWWTNFPHVDLVTTVVSVYDIRQTGKVRQSLQHFRRNMTMPTLLISIV